MRTTTTSSGAASTRSSLVTQTPPVPTTRLPARNPIGIGDQRPGSSLGRSGTRRCRASCPPRPHPRRRRPGWSPGRSAPRCRPAAGVGHPDGPRGRRDVQGARRTVMVATLRLVARSMRVTASSRGAPRSPGATLAIHSAHRRRRWLQRAQGRAVARRRPRWSPGRSGPPCRRRPAPKGPRRPRSRTGAGKGDDRGEPAAVEGGHDDPGAGGARWRLGRSRVLGVSATSAHAAAASSTATIGVLCQRGARSGDGQRLAGLSAIAFTRACERNFWSFAQTTWV
jgi:hypothetical protein